MEEVLVVVFEFDPASAVGNDLSEEISLRLLAFEEDAGRAMQLADDDALGSIDDEGSVFGHQRDFAEEDLLLLDVADGLVAGLGVLVEDGETDGDFEGSGIGHAALFAFGDIVLELEADGIAAAVAESDDILVEGAAARAQNVAQVERIGFDGGAAGGVAAGGAQMVQPFEVAALALPVSDGVIDELELAQAAKIGDGEDAFKNAFEPRVVSLTGKQVHLEKAFIGLFLNLDQVRDRNRGFDLRKINSFPMFANFLGLHVSKSSSSESRERRSNGAIAGLQLEPRLKTKMPEGQIHFGLEMCTQGEA